eukprot:CAMPEP_0183360846 /NCGR_PEP_ID=MMETSP0164_2-20130417/56109_1 /TAXON_ID=221442 /ORGANISM="Coccolithus pelagicus ssp braarudi, Strain PLY182g" /LENGTH=388 /DNA_ID=CAMNT_0025535287 /DNA_START=31 /DNA_END=1193 /DNA_ORIENTATION=+
MCRKGAAAPSRSVSHGKELSVTMIEAEATNFASATAKKAARAQKKEAKTKQDPQVSIGELYGMASSADLALLLIGVLASSGCGALLPIILVVFTSSIDAVGNTSSGALDLDEMIWQSLLLIIIGVALWVGTSIYMAATDIAKVRMMARYKKEYVRAIIHQEIGWFDEQNPAQLAPGIGQMMTIIEDGISNKSMQLFENAGTGIGCFIVAFYYNPYVALVVLGTFPLVAGAGALLQYVQVTSAQKITEAYSDSGGRANEALSSMRTVASFGLEGRTAELYQVGLRAAEKAGLRAAILGGAAMAVFMATMEIMIGVGLLFGGAFVATEYKASSFDLTMVDSNGSVLNYCANDCGNPYDRFNAITEPFNVSCASAVFGEMSSLVPYRLTCA